jgi:hypothetical protein
MNTKAQQNPVKGEILADTNNALFIKVWGNAEERGYAYGYLANEKIKIISEGYIQLSFGSSYAAARQLLIDGQTLMLDSIFMVEIHAVLNGMADAGVDTTDFDYIDLLLINFNHTLEGFFGKSDLYCSTFLNWGDATLGTDLDGGSVISRHYDGSGYLAAAANNGVTCAFLPDEENTQPWLTMGSAGKIVASACGVNQAGISIYQNAMSDCYASSIPGIMYEPFELTARKVLMSADYNEDGANNTQDVWDGIISNPQGYAIPIIVSTIAKWNPESDSLTALIAELAPEDPKITFRTNSFNDSILGDNLYAANRQIKRNNALNYCSRYLNMVNHMGDGTGIGSQENWNLMAEYSHGTGICNYAFIQHIPDKNILKISNYRDNTQAYLLEPVTINLREYFNRSPQFISEPDTVTVIDTEYIYDVVVSDPDPDDTITFLATEIPYWLNMVDYGNGVAALSGVPSETGIYQVILKASDGKTEETQSFNIVVNLMSTGEFNIVIPKIYPNPFQDKISIENGEGSELTILSSSGATIINQYILNKIHVVDMDLVPSGIYFLRIKIGKETITKKIIKVH